LCLGGEHGCPPDDLPGCAREYPEFVKVVMDKSHPMREERLYFAFKDETFDSEKFDITTVQESRTTWNSFRVLVISLNNAQQKN